LLSSGCRLASSEADMGNDAFLVKNEVLHSS